MFVGFSVPFAAFWQAWRGAFGRFVGAGLLLALAPTVQAQAAWVQVELGGHAGAVRRIDADPVRGLVVTGADDKTARVWALDGGALQRVLRPPVGAGEIGRIYGVALNAQRGWVAVGGTAAQLGAAGPSLQIYDAATGESVRRIDARGGDVKRLLWSPDGSVLVAGYADDPAVRVFDLEGQEVFSDRFSGAVYGLAVAPGILVAAGLDGSLRVYADQGVGRSPRYVEQWRRQVAANPVSLAIAPDAAAVAVGYFLPGKAPDVVDLRTQRLTEGVAPASLGRSTLLSVAWTADGRRVVAGGDYGFARRNARLVLAEPGSRFIEEVDIGAGSTVTDLRALANGQHVFASADGSWGVLDLTARRSRLIWAELPDLDGAGQLLIGADGRQLSWTLDAGRSPVHFDFEQRVAAPGRGAALDKPLLRRGLLDAPSNWENDRAPQVNGARIALAPEEISRAVALFPQGPDAVLGTSRALWRIGPGGATVWRRPTQTEVRAVHIADRGRLLVAAMLDGTVRLHRASDGEELLTLLVLKDRRWVMWTPDGYFDAAVGADRIVGWAVNREDGSAADYYPVARFRERFHQPRYIDLLLQTLDPAQAAAQHRAERALEPMAPALAVLPPGLPGPDATPSEPLQTLLPLAALLAPQSLPPALLSPWRVIDLIVPRPDAAVAVAVAVPMTVRSGGSELAFEVRIDGRPESVATAVLIQAGPGLMRGTVQLQVPAHALTVQLVARDRNGSSEPWVLSVRAVQPPSAVASLPATLPAPTAGVAPLLPGAAAWAVLPGAAAWQPLSALSLPTTAAAAAAASLPAVPSLPGVVLATVPTTGRLFVLTIGVSDYVRAEYRLRLAAKDAADFGKAIRLQQSKLYREVVVRQLLDRDATRANVLAALQWLARQGGKGDTYMLFMAGHGANGTSGSYYFMTADARHEDMPATALSDREIRQALQRIPGRMLMFIDTCHAGNALGSTTGRHSEVARFVNDMSDNGVVVFAASSGRQESLESDAWGNGAFTLALIDGLGGKADPLRAGRVTYKGLDYYVSESVQRLTKGLQTPVSLSPIGVPDFEVARL